MFIGAALRAAVGVAMAVVGADLMPVSSTVPPSTTIAAFLAAAGSVLLVHGAEQLRLKVGTGNS